MRYHVLLLVVVAHLLWIPASRGDVDDVGSVLDRVAYGFSRNGDYCIRVSVGSPNAQIQLFRYDRHSRRCVLVRSTRLPYWNAPLRILVSCDGRFVVALGKRTGEYDLRNEIWIWDTRRELSKSIHLDAVLTKADLDRYASQIPMVPGICWFADERQDGLPPVFDVQRQVLYVTVGVNGPSLGADYNRRYTIERPTVVIDLKAMTARKSETRRVSLWKERHDRAVMTNRLLDSLLRSYMRGPDYELMKPLVEQSIRPPSVEMRPVGEKWLFRLEPGNGQMPASIVALKYVEDEDAFICIREMMTFNPVAPCDWRVSHDAKYIVTVDDINGLGTTRNALAIYRLADGKRKRFALKEFLLPSEIAKLRVARNFIAWRSAIWNMNAANIDGRTIEINRYGPTELPRVFVSLDKMAVSVRRQDRTQGQ